MVGNEIYAEICGRQTVNATRCHVMRISRNTNFLSYPYSLSNCPLSSIDSVRDLGIFYDCLLLIALSQALITQTERQVSSSAFVRVSGIF